MTPKEADPDRNRATGTRLTPMETMRELFPWRRAEALTRCSLYWMPVNSFPIPDHQRLWLMRFIDRLTALLLTEIGLRVELFLQNTAIPPLQKAFVQTSSEFSPIIGLSRKPGAELARLPTSQELAPVLEGETEFDAQWMPDYCYWFLTKAEHRQREVFFGHGAMTILFMKPDPNTTPPELPLTPAFRNKHQIFKVFDFDKMLAGAFALKDGFLSKSKELFGADLATQPHFVGMPFVLPTLSTADFFARPAEECDKWFQLFDVCINESAPDGGILMASKSDLDKPLIGIVTQMKEEGLTYPER